MAKFIEVLDELLDLVDQLRERYVTDSEEDLRDLDPDGYRLVYGVDRRIGALRKAMGRQSLFMHRRMRYDPPLADWLNDWAEGSCETIAGILHHAPRSVVVKFTRDLMYWHMGRLAVREGLVPPNPADLLADLLRLAELAREER